MTGSAANCLLAPCNTLVAHASPYVTDPLPKQKEGETAAADTLRLKGWISSRSPSKLIRHLKNLSRQRALPLTIRPTIWFIIPAIISTNRVPSNIQTDEFSDAHDEYDQSLRALLDPEDDTAHFNKMELSLTSKGLSFSTNNLLHPEYADYLLLQSRQNFIEQPATSVINDITTKISLPVHRILLCLSHDLNILFSPLLPDLTAILLTSLAEVHVFIVLKYLLGETFNRRAGNKLFKIPISVQDYDLTCQAFNAILSRNNQNASYFYQQHSLLTPSGLEPIFRRFLVNILPFPCIIHLMDLFVIDGMKALFRIAQALLVTYYNHFTQQRDVVHHGENVWPAIRRYTHESTFSWETLICISYNRKTTPPKKHKATVIGSKQIRLYIPRRRTISTIMAKLHCQENSNQQYCQELDMQCERLSMIQCKPIPFVQQRDPCTSINMLLNPISFRYTLAQWLPHKLRTCKLELIYSSRTMPMSIQFFYQSVKKSNHTIVILKSLEKGYVVGMYASKEWSIQPRPYGDGQCFLFRLFPDHQCFKWSRIMSDNASLTTLTLNQQFMTSTSKYFAMGGSSDGGFGLGINDDLTKAYSTRSLTFDNDPLCGEEYKHGFEIQTLEVYRFVQDVTGVPVY